MMEFDPEQTARDAARKTLADEAPKYANDPGIYRGYIEASITKICHHYGTKARAIILRIQNIAWNKAQADGTLDNPAAIFDIAVSEITAIKAMNKADDERLQREHPPLAKTEPVRLGAKMPKEKKAELFSAPGMPSVPDMDKPAELMSDNIDDIIPREPATPPAALTAESVAEPDPTEKPTNNWATTKHLAEWQAAANDVAFTMGIGVKEARAWWLSLLEVPDETQIPVSGDAALKLLKKRSGYDAKMATQKATPTPEPEPEPPQTREQPVHAVDMETGEIIDATLIPYEPQRAVERVQNAVAIIKSLKKQVFIKGVHYGPQPGAPEGAPDVLKKPGAEMLANAHHYCPKFELVSSVEQWDVAKPLFNYKYRCILVEIETGNAIAEGIGSANTLEKKHRWRWVQAHDLPANLDKGTLLTKSGVKSEFTFAIDKAETSGKYGKPAAYWQEFKDAIANGTARSIKRATANGKEYDAWEIGSTMYRIPNDEVFDLVNTVDKMAQKRALVAAVLIGCNASEFFTQDEDDED